MEGVFVPPCAHPPSPHLPHSCARPHLDDALILERDDLALCLSSVGGLKPSRVRPQVADLPSREPFRCPHCLGVPLYSHQKPFCKFSASGLSCPSRGGSHSCFSCAGEPGWCLHHSLGGTAFSQMQGGPRQRALCRLRGLWFLLCKLVVVRGR